MSVGNTPCAGFGIHILGEAFADGVDAPAGMKLSFENDNVVPRILQFPCRRQPGQSTAQDRNAAGAPLPRPQILRKRPAQFRRQAQPTSRKSHEPQKFPTMNWHDRVEYYSGECFLPTG